jgi:signal transduction histidine kinase
VSVTKTYVLAFIALLAMVGAFMAFVTQADQARYWVDHTYAVSNAIQNARLDFAGGDFARAERTVEHIALLTMDNASQRARIVDLKSALKAQDRSRFEKIAADMDSREKELLRLRQGHLGQTNLILHISFLALSLGTAAAIAFSLKTNRDFNKHMEAKNAALEEASRAKDVFLASMSHELRTPLNSIMGFVGILLMKLPGPLNQEQDRQLRVVQGSARHLLSLINDILDLARIESGRVEIVMDEVSITEVVKQACTQLRPLAENKQLVLREEVPAGECTVRSDQRSANQILLNIIGNAIKFTREGEVVVRVANQPESVSVGIQDTGPGMSAEQQAQLFDAFSRLKQSEHQEGTGLGLHLSRRLADLIGARITVASEAGMGTTFTVEFPKQV